MDNSRLLQLYYNCIKRLPGTLCTFILVALYMVLIYVLHSPQFMNTDRSLV